MKIPLNLVLLAGAGSATAQSISMVYTATFTDTVVEFATITTCPPCPTTFPSSSSFSFAPSPSLSFPVSVSVSNASLSSSTSLTTGPVLPDNTITASGSSSSTSASTSSFVTIATTTSAGSVSTSTSTSSGSGGALPSVTTAAYISAVLVHHNIHRSNHSAVSLVWSPSLAETARQIAQTCVYGHVTNLNGGGYGQNIGAGYPPTPLGMGTFITEGLYNGEAPNYTPYYGTEPDLSTLNQWGHFTQIVWKSTASVGCYSADCTASGLSGVGGGVTPFFTVCNYAPPGNFIGDFAPNVGLPLGLPTVHGDYGLS